MNNETIVAYIATERARGVSDEAIKSALLTQGWKVDDVTSAMGSASATSAPREFSFANLFVGRLRRWQYFSTGLLFGLAVGVVIFLLGVASRFFGGVSFLVVVALYVLMVPFSISFSVRRAHDMNWSGWTMLLMFIPFVNFIVALVFLFKKGTDGPNTYGPPQGDRNFKDTVLNL